MEERGKEEQRERKKTKINQKSSRAEKEKEIKHNKQQTKQGE
jgi:hypothetical protein